jgi:NADH:ubiquinone oxidoreductase subunit F (NADH-binding)
MTTALKGTSPRGSSRAPGGITRVLPPRPEDLRQHLSRVGPVPYRGRAGALIAEIAAAGLTGRGGAALPTHRKLEIVASAGGEKVVVANGAEGEPASRKDEALLSTAPHLVLDGLQLAAEAVGATTAYLYLHQGAAFGVDQALRERALCQLDMLRVTVVETPPWLVGGYHGTWLPPEAGLTVDNHSLRPLGGAVGAGVLAALPADRCGVAETARVVGYLAAESAGQCGPCLNGLPRTAAALGELAGTRPRQRARADIERWAALVSGRGACAHPDGTVRLIRSALRGFAHEFRHHERGHCTAVNRRPFLPIPNKVPTDEDDWT